ncbi:MAG: 16S rRNA (cytosine(967)-C(5))-methyltransferase [Hydrogenophilales bacterium 28-61-23]|nr:MAG: 16S rRNA (cytosine(967)-C(5))-methyltransferase [Hydrogenophilales bacterium 28-61-23]
MPSLDSSPRLLAANMVNAVLLDGTSLTATLANLRANSAAESRDLAAAQNLAYGVLRQAGRLRFFLARLTQRPVQPDELNGHLLVGLHELDAGLAPAYAAVNETVAVAAHRFPYARAFVNAVLRNFQRSRETLAQAALQNPEAHWNFPLWWLKRLQAEYPADWENIVTAQNNRPPMTLRVNPRRTTLADYRSLLDEAGLKHRVLSASGLMLLNPVPVAELPGFSAGLVSVQDLGAQLAAPLLDVAPGKAAEPPTAPLRVLDACAAPGGKTSHLLEIADLDLVALDNDATRLHRVRENLDRLGLAELPGSSIGLLAEDAGKPSLWWDKKPFDRILLDAPCTASGVVRRHPDGKWLKRAEDMQHLANEQSRLLEALWPLLKPGGRMLYATCSLFAAENTNQMTAFVARHPDAQIDAIEMPNAPEGQLKGQLIPGPDTDGFFYARLFKT